MRPEIHQMLLDLLGKSYSPYSHYPVAAVVESESGKLYGGVNVENAAYPLGRCAEQSAILQMVSSGEQDIKQVWVMSRGEEPATPCGGCRQILAEFALPEVPIHCESTNGAFIKTTMAEILPFAFSGKILNKK